MIRALSAAWSIAMMACGPLGVVLLIGFASRGDLIRGLFDFLLGIAVCTIGFDNLRKGPHP